MKRIALLLSVIALMVLACTHTVKVPLMPDYNAEIAPDNQLKTLTQSIDFCQGNFGDKRSDTSMLASFKEGIHTFNLFEERDIDEALFEGLGVLFATSGHKWTGKEAGAVRVDLTLLNLQASRHAGFVNVGASSSVQIKVDFVKLPAGDILFSQIYNGSDDRKQAMIGKMEMVKKSIDASLIDCINSIGADQGLVNALKKL